MNYRVVLHEPRGQLMSLISKPIDQISVADLEALVIAAARETGELEFKGALPFKAEKGLPQQADRWIEIGDRIGDYARDELLSELVAFANADGGTLVLGVAETQEFPRAATGLCPLPRCEDLARRLLDATEDTIEPRIPVIAVRAVPAAPDGSGFVVMRVGKSLLGPHRLSTKREFFVRRGERTSRMSVREIKDLTLELARTGDRVEAVFRERQAVAEAAFKSMTEAARDETPPLLVRVSAVPVAPFDIPDITSRQDLWWTGREFALEMGEQRYRCEYPARDFVLNPAIRLRCLELLDYSDDRPGLHRVLRSDGLAEILFAHPKLPPYHGKAPVPRVYFSWILGPLVGVIAQIEHLRRKLAREATIFGLEVEIWSSGHLDLSWEDRDFGRRAAERAAMPLRLPRYPIGERAQFDAIVTQSVKDLTNAWGRSWETNCTAPWSALLD
jgi:hypothetical protein